MSKLLAVACRLGLSSLLEAAVAHAESQPFYDTAEVTAVEPIYQTVRVAHPEERCWIEEAQHADPAPASSVAGPILGGIIGGVVGHQFGGGRGKDAMTVAGTLVGAAVGQQASAVEQSSAGIQQERHCEVVDHYEEQRRLSGYRVEYRYRDHVFVTETGQRPSSRIRVRVDVAPIDS